MTNAEREVYLPEVFNRAFREALIGPDADIALAVAVNAVRDATLAAVRKMIQSKRPPLLIVGTYATPTLVRRNAAQARMCDDILAALDGMGATDAK
jgi:CO dehydrogenase/acetyl-CoA synthase epsilon subunit